MKQATKVARLLALIFVSTTLATGLGFAQKANDHGMFTPGDVSWKDGPASLPAGSQVAVLEGNPREPGIFTMRLRFPDGYRIPPHWHPVVERVTVVAGTFHLGMGETFDQAKAKTLPAGSFFYMPPETAHFVWVEGETIVQITGEGPWGITYLNPADDPRQAKQSAR